MAKIKQIGIIAEDDSDFDSVRTLIKRIVNKDNLPFKKAVSEGCGKLKRKAFSYAGTLRARGCDLLIVVHDRDKNDLGTLRRELESIIRGNPFRSYLICIPVEELEAWFLSDPAGIKEALNLKRTPNISGLPENIISPKEKLEELIYLCSNKEKVYLNTKHNNLIATKVSIESIRQKCPSFVELFNFLNTYQF